MLRQRQGLGSGAALSSRACTGHTIPAAPALQARLRRCCSSVPNAPATTRQVHVRLPGPLEQQEQHAASDSTTAPSRPEQELASWLEQYDQQYATPDEMSLWDDEDGSYYSSRRDLQLAYLPPKSDLPGLAVAVGLITAWACVFKHAVFGYDMGADLTLPHLVDGILTFASLEFLSTGLFITTREQHIHTGCCSTERCCMGYRCLPVRTLYLHFELCAVHAMLGSLLVGGGMCTAFCTVRQTGSVL